MPKTPATGSASVSATPVLVALAAAEDALEAILLALDAALEAAEPVAVSRLAASDAMLLWSEDIWDEMDDCTDAGAVAASDVKDAMSLKALVYRVLTSDKAELTAEPAAEVTEAKPLVASEKIDPAPLVAVLAAPPSTDVTVLNAPPIAEVISETGFWAAARLAAETRTIGVIFILTVNRRRY